jgi:hypothetical protein
MDTKTNDPSSPTSSSTSSTPDMALSGTSPETLKQAFQDLYKEEFRKSGFLVPDDWFMQDDYHRYVRKDIEMAWTGFLMGCKWVAKYTIGRGHYEHDEA